jgi:hypothetical protein
MSLDLAAVTSEDFSRHVGSRFEVCADADAGIAVPVPLDLIEVAVAPRLAGQRRIGFSLLFRGPHGLYLAQRIYHLQHEAMGNLDIFLVPIAPAGDGSRFEAVFN